MTPTIFFDVAGLALQCVCSRMEEIAVDTEIEGYACPCYIYVSAGEPPIDCCQVDCEPGGMLTVHVEDVFASDNFPDPTTGFTPCKASTWVARLVVTAARCAPVTHEDGSTPEASELSDNARLMAVDQYAILTALGCCLVEANVPGKRKRRVQIESSRPLISEGGCASVEVRALVEIGPICGCNGGS